MLAVNMLAYRVNICSRSEYAVRGLHTLGVGLV